MGVTTAPVSGSLGWPAWMATVSNRYEHDRLGTSDMVEPPGAGQPLPRRGVARPTGWDEMTQDTSAMTRTVPGRWSLPISLVGRGESASDPANRTQPHAEIDSG